MKKLIYFLLALIVTLALPAKAEIKIEKGAVPEKPGIHLMVFFKTGEDPRIEKPYLIIGIISISAIEKENLKKWQEEIHTKITDLGGINSQDDFEKAGKVIAEYLPLFFKAKAVGFTMEFPKVAYELSLQKK